MQDTEPLSAFMLMGNGVDENGHFHHVHTSHFDFNDKALLFGIGYWVALIKAELG